MTSSKKNIGIVLDKEFQSDIRVNKEANILAEMGFNVYVLCFSFNKEVEIKNEKIKIDLIHIPKKVKDILFFFMVNFPLYEFLWTFWIKRFILKNDIDTIHAHDLYMSKCSYNAIRSTKKNIDFILDLHENFPVAIGLYNWASDNIRGYVSGYKKWKQKEKEYLKYPSKLIVLSNYFKNKLINTYSFLNEKNVFVFNNSIDIRLFDSFPCENALLKKTDRITLFYFGIIAERRGIFDLLKVFEKAVFNNLNIDLVLIGPTDKLDKNEFNKFIAKKHLKKHISYIPWIELKELPAYLNITDIGICPLLKNDQHESGVANKIYQYMFGAIPIIASNCLPQKQLIEKYKCGLVYENDTDFYSCIEKLVHNNSLRTKMGLNGKSSLLKYYNKEKIENQLSKVFQ